MGYTYMSIWAIASVQKRLVTVSHHSTQKQVDKFRNSGRDRAGAKPLITNENAMALRLLYQKDVVHVVNLLRFGQ